MSNKASASSSLGVALVVLFAWIESGNIKAMRGSLCQNKDYIDENSSDGNDDVDESACAISPYELNSITNRQGETLLYVAVESEQLAIVELLLDCGADPNMPNKLLPKKTTTKRNWESTILRFIAKHWDYCGIDSVRFRILELLLKHGANPNANRSRRCHRQGGQSVHPNSGGQQRWIADSLADSVSAATASTPLCIAIVGGRVEIVELLLNQGDADPNKVGAAGVDGYPLNLAIQRYVKLISGTRVERVNRSRSLRIIQMLLEHPEVDQNRTDHFGHTYLDRAVSQGDAALLQLLLEGGADPNGGFGRNTAKQATIRDASPLEKAVLLGHIGCVRVLLDVGVLPLDGSFLPRDRTAILLSALAKSKNALLTKDEYDKIVALEFKPYSKKAARPDIIFDLLEHVEILKLQPKQSSSIPKEIVKLRHSLTTLSIMNSAALARLPSEIGGLENLKTLEIAGCYRFESLPHELAKLPNLKTLRIIRCALKKIPSGSVLPSNSLLTLDLSENNICVFEDADLHLPRKLQNLRLVGNPVMREQRFEPHLFSMLQRHSHLQISDLLKDHSYPSKSEGDSSSTSHQASSTQTAFSGGSSSGGSQLLTPRIWYMSAMNAARCRMSNVPLSAWPVVFANVQALGCPQFAFDQEKRLTAQANVVFELLQGTPAMDHLIHG